VQSVSCSRPEILADLSLAVTTGEQVLRSDDVAGALGVYPLVLHFRFGRGNLDRPNARLLGGEVFLGRPLWSLIMVCSVHSHSPVLHTRGSMEGGPESHVESIWSRTFSIISAQAWSLAARRWTQMKLVPVSCLCFRLFIAQDLQVQVGPLSIESPTQLTVCCFPGTLWLSTIHTKGLPSIGVTFMEKFASTFAGRCCRRNDGLPQAGERCPWLLQTCFPDTVV